LKLCGSNPLWGFTQEENMKKLTKEQKDLFEKKYFYEMMQIGIYHLFGNEKCATCIAKKILAKEGLIEIGE